MDPHIFDDQESVSAQRYSDSLKPAKYAGFWIRFVAFLIDSLLASLLIAPLVRYLFASDINPLDFFRPENIMTLDLASMLTFIYSQIFSLAITVAIIIVFWIYRSATPGKIILGLKIVQANNLQPLSTGQCFARYLGYYLSSLFFCMGFLWVAFDTRKQGWHDKISNTLVIYNEDN